MHKAILHEETRKELSAALGSLQSQFDRREWAAGYQNAQAFPEGFWLPCEGRIPPQLEGTYFRNGPGLFRHGKETVAHPFDGHGLLASISFKDGRAFFRSSYVQTKEYLDETSCDSILYPGTFGTRSGGFFSNLLQHMSPRNVANTGIIAWGSKFLALFEAGQPYRWNPQTLATEGIDLLGQTIRRGAPFSTGWGFSDKLAGFLLAVLGIGRNMSPEFKLGGDAVSAHSIVDPVQDRLVLFTFRLQLGWVAFRLLLWGFVCTFWLPGLVTKLAVREYDEAFQQQAVTTHTLPGYAFLHDISVTAQSYVIVQNPVSLSMLPLLLGLSCPAHCIEWKGEPAALHILRRPSSDNIDNMPDSAQRRLSLSHSTGPCASGKQIVTQKPAFVFHQANAYESVDGRSIVVDCVRYPSMPDFKQSTSSRPFMETVDADLQPISQLHRYTANLETGECKERLLCERAMEFPTVNPNFTGRENTFLFAAAALNPTANRPQQALAKLNTKSGELLLWGRGLHYYVGEPVFVPGPNSKVEDEGWLLSICLDAELQKSECVVLDTKSMQILACLDLGHILPYGLHGSWNDSYFGPK